MVGACCTFETTRGWRLVRQEHCLSHFIPAISVDESARREKTGLKTTDMPTAKNGMLEEPWKRGDSLDNADGGSSQQGAPHQNTDKDFKKAVPDEMENSSSDLLEVLDSNESSISGMTNTRPATPQRKDAIEPNNKLGGDEMEMLNELRTPEKDSETRARTAADDSQDEEDGRLDKSHLAKPWDTRADPLSNERMARLETFGSTRRPGSRSASTRPPTPRFVRLRPHSTEISDAELEAVVNGALFTGKVASRRNASTTLEEDVALLANKRGGDKAPRRSATGKKGKSRNPPGKKFRKFFCCAKGSDSPSPVRASRASKAKPEVTIRIRTRRGSMASSPTASPLLTSPVDVEIFENSMFSHEEDPTTKILAVTESNDSRAPSLVGYVNNGSEEAGELEEMVLIARNEEMSKEGAETELVLEGKAASTRAGDDGDKGVNADARSVGDGAEAEDSLYTDGCEVSVPEPGSGIDSEGTAADHIDNAADTAHQEGPERAVQENSDGGSEARSSRSASSSSESQQGSPTTNFYAVNMKAGLMSSHSMFYFDPLMSGGNITYEYDISKIHLAELCSRFLQDIAKSGLVGAKPALCIVTPGPFSNKPAPTSGYTIEGIPKERVRSHGVEVNAGNASSKADGSDVDTPVSQRTTPRTEKVPSYIPYGTPRSSPRETSDATSKREAATSPMQTPLSKFASRGRLHRQRSRQGEGSKSDAVSKRSTKHCPQEQKIPASASVTESSTSSFTFKSPGNSSQKLSGNSSLLESQFSSEEYDSFPTLRSSSTSCETLASRMSIPLCLSKDWNRPYGGSAAAAASFSKSQSSEDVSKMVLHLDKLASKFCSLSAIPTEGAELGRNYESRSPWRRGSRSSLTSQSDLNPGASWSKYHRYGGGNGIPDRKASRSVAEKIISFEEATLLKPAGRKSSLGDVPKKLHDLDVLVPPLKRPDDVQMTGRGP